MWLKLRHLFSLIRRKFIMKQFFVCACALLLLVGCAEGSFKSMDDVTKNLTSTKAEPQLEIVRFADLPYWSSDQHLEALQAFEPSCQRILKRDPTKEFSQSLALGRNADWIKACAARPALNAATNETARVYFETYFEPLAVTDGSTDTGLFTGYFEASLNGSLARSDKFSVPLRARPSDLVMVNLGEFREELKGQRIAGRVVGGALKPYEDRTEIETGQLPDAQDKALLWVDSAVEAFFLQVQGSGVVTLPDGSTRRVGYDGQNGHIYSAIGGELIRRGHLEKGTVSMQSIKAWMEKNPVEAIEVMRTNKSYVFFRFIDGDHKVSGPIGGEGVPLTAERSLAIDHGLYPYGVPFYVDIAHPTKAPERLQKLMIAQDTGGAIKGVIRGDYFWGHGDYAETQAGPMASKGRFFLLRPKH